MMASNTRRLREIEALAPWFHNLHLPDGTETAPAHPLGDFPRYKWQTIAEILPEDLHGCRALDVGCNAGHHSFELARRGARVLGVDHDPHYLRQAAWAAREFGLEHAVEFRRLQVYDLVALGEQFDVVLFLGVLYHLRYPLLGLDIVARLTRRWLVFQSLTVPAEAGPIVEDIDDIYDRETLVRPDWPTLSFVERRYAGDPTNWWVPNEPAVLAMLRSAGLRVVASPGHEIHLCEPLAADAPERAPYDVTPELRAATGLDRAAMIGSG